MVKKQGVFWVIAFLLSFSFASARTLAISARAFYSAMYSDSLGEVLDLKTVNSAYGVELNADIFLGPRLSITGLFSRTFMGRYGQYYMAYGGAVRFWKRNHFWSIGAKYFDHDHTVINLNAPSNLVLAHLALGLFGGEGINWIIEFPIQAGMELNTRVFYGDIGIQAGLLFSI